MQNIFHYMKPNLDVYTVSRNLLDPTPNCPAALGYKRKAKLFTLKTSFLSKILFLADMGEGRVWIRLGRVKIGYVVHFALAQT